MVPYPRRLRLLVAAPLLAALSGLGCASGPAPHAHAPAAAPAAPPPLFTDLGSYHRTITTASPEAQAYFDQGLRLFYSFNHYEALASFREAARLDPRCALCEWGTALSLGSNYNSPTDPERERTAYAAARRAQELAAGADERERALIAATLQRHSSDPAADRKALDKAYADALREVVARFPDDLDAATIFADSLMNLRPWDLWLPDGQPHPGTAEAIATLERVLAAAPDHPGANHLYVHALEASPDPGRAEAAADRLRDLVPGAGHMVHMPSHIYLRIGRYADSAAANERAVAADHAYFARREPSPIYRMLYYPHNIDFIWASAAMEGRSAEALRAARELAGVVALEDVRQMSDMEIAPVAPLYVLARFGRWEEILREPAPPAELLYTTGIWRYARGLAAIGTGRLDEAQRELDALTAHIATVPAERTLAGFFKTVDMLRLAENVLAGELAARRGETDEAVRRLQAAAEAQDGHWFTEPPPWYYPVRQSLGAVLLAAGRAAEAEAVYREDLRRNPANGWSLFGLAEALRAQDKAAEADAADAEFRRAWARADVTLTASRFP